MRTVTYSAWAALIIGLVFAGYGLVSGEYAVAVMAIPFLLLAPAAFARRDQKRRRLAEIAARQAEGDVPR